MDCLLLINEFVDDINDDENDGNVDYDDSDDDEDEGGFAFNQWQGATYQMTALGRPIHLLCSRLTRDFSFIIKIIIVIIDISIIINIMI